MIIDSSTWTGRPSVIVRDDDGISDWDWAEMRRETLREMRLDRFKALKALWLPARRHPPRDRRKGWTVYDGHERARDEEWTFWRSILATVAIVTARYHGQAQVDRHGHQFGVNVAYFDAFTINGGYTSTIVELFPGCRVAIFEDGETNL